MALDVPAVREGLRRILENQLGGEIQVATAPDQVTPPCLLIGMPRVTYHQAFRRGLDTSTWPLYALFPRTHDQSAIDASDRWISGGGPESVVTIVNAAKTLGGACDAAMVIDATPDLWPGSTGELPAYRFDIEVYG